MDIERLDDFSLRTAEQLFTRFPSWRPLATVEKAEDGSCYLHIEVPAPQGANAAHGLTITTANEEVTVGFDHYHSHFPSMVGDGEQFGTDYAMHFIEQLLAEKVAVVSWWQGDKWRGSSTMDAGAMAMPSDFMKPFDIERVRSWNGGLNADRAA
jgi:hypothetical protein